MKKKTQDERQTAQDLEGAASKILEKWITGMADVVSLDEHLAAEDWAGATSKILENWTAGIAQIIDKLNTPQESCQQKPPESGTKNS